jgi:SAM-dependent methyltransferase
MADRDDAARRSGSALTAMQPYYRADLARIHHLGFGAHADACAPGILSLLEPTRQAGGIVLELGCGSGRLTRHLVDAGHAVIATDASPAMLDLARGNVRGAVDVCRVTLPEDPLPEADAIVSVGHVLSYLPDPMALDRALVAIARALKPEGILAIDLCDLEWGRARRNAEPAVFVQETWVLVTRFSSPRPDRFVREMTMFSKNDDGTWRRDDERHDNLLIETTRVPPFLVERGVDARIAPSFGSETLPMGLVAVIGNRRAAGRGDAVLSTQT